MEMEFFCSPDSAETLFEYWTQQRLNWWKSLGVRDENLILRKHGDDELAHYSKDGLGTYDIEYAYPFSDGYGELEGIAHRGNFDLSQHQTHSGTKMEYFDPQTRERFIPHVIEPASGLATWRPRLAHRSLRRRREPTVSRANAVQAQPRADQGGDLPAPRKDGLPEVAQTLHGPAPTPHLPDRREAEHWQALRSDGRGQGPLGALPSTTTP